MEAHAWALAAKPPAWASLRQHCKESSSVDLHPSAPFRSLGCTTINIKDLLYESGVKFRELGGGRNGAISQQRSGTGRFAGGQLGKTSSIQSGNRTTFPRHCRSVGVFVWKIALVLDDLFLTDVWVLICKAQAKAITVPPMQDNLSGPCSRETGREEIQRRGAFNMVVCSLTAGGLGVSECAFTGLAPLCDE
ncbi:hypothetical protein DPX16_8463 [Anabarilius grahami]|uniref:Uncharacterized protein n=1 Tax=Anabarilius grahami TaxID=495550 RepID=A0A3N0Z332_ANAGA|nr:hypothetical protein DPX16_8463 [Anabarilius grahami]